MARLGALIGIGLMLMGACAFALPAENEFHNLLPAFAGIVIASASITALHWEGGLKLLPRINGYAAIFLLIYVCFRLPPDIQRAHTDNAWLISDLDVLMLALLLIGAALRKQGTVPANAN